MPTTNDYIELSGELVDEYKAEKIAQEKLIEIKLLFIDYHIIKRLMNSCSENKDYVKKIYDMDKSGVLQDLFTHPNIRRVSYHLSLFDIKTHIARWISEKDDNIYQNIKDAIKTEHLKDLEEKPNIEVCENSKDREERNARYLASKSRYGDKRKASITLHSK